MRNALTALLFFVATTPAMALNIVITNDDGFETPNIQALYDVLVDAGHDVILSFTHKAASFPAMNCRDVPVRSIRAGRAKYP